MKLNIDWEKIFPEEHVTIGGQKISIRPLGIQDLFSMLSWIKPILAELAEIGIGFDNMAQDGNLQKVLFKITEACPTFFADAARIDQADFSRLPAAYQTEIMVKVIDVNLKDAELLTKNCKSLINYANKALAAGM